jgi:NAD(P)-dependent dehydrogenase (short-subunit alcohol dehydrogenase family)
MQANFSATTTTSDVLEGFDLRNKTVVITGASSGLGLETARSMAEAGATIIMAARNPEKIAQAKQQILQATPQAMISEVQLDLSDLNSVRKAAETLKQRDVSIDILINNAGVMACPFERTQQGFEMQFGSNHLGHFLFTLLLLPQIKKQQGSRIINLSSAAHKFASVNLDDPNYEQRTYNKWQAYGEAKSANALFALELNERVKQSGIEAYSVHPGMIATNLGRHLDENDLKMLMGGSKKEQIPANQTQPKPKKDKKNSSPFKTIEQGAATSVWAATSHDLSGKGGVYLEDCQIAQASDSNNNKASTGYSSHIADKALAKSLWQLSEQLVNAYISPQVN